MKDEIHPEYFQAQVTCGGCGSVYTMGSTKAELSVGVCAGCHPFYTGKQKLLDSEGRIDKFNAKYAKFAQPAKKKK